MINTKKDSNLDPSIRDIIDQNHRQLRIEEIKNLFTVPSLSEIDTAELKCHPFMLSNDLFTFFVHQLEKWNKKIRNREITPFFYAELNRNTFVYSSLKLIILKKPNIIDRQLQELAAWYSKHSYNAPQTSVLMKKYVSSEEQNVRKTFKSNTPSQINHYQRRFLFSPDENISSLYHNQNKRNNCFLKSSNSNPQKIYAQIHTKRGMNKNVISQFSEPFCEIIIDRKKKISTSKNNKVRKEREQKQICRAQKEWKASQSRLYQKSCQNFNKGQFKLNNSFIKSSRPSSNKLFRTFYDNRQSVQQELFKSIKNRKLQTSLGIKNTFTDDRQSQINSQKISNMKTQNNDQTKQNLKEWIDNFIVDQDRIDLMSTLDRTDPGTRLISNPLDPSNVKFKKKRN